MFDFNVILSCDTSHHMEFVPLCARAWKKFYPECKTKLAIVPTGPRPDWIGEWVDEYQVFDNINGLENPSITKLARLFLSTKYGKEIVTFNDIDLIPLQREFYADRLGNFIPGKILRMGMEVYDQTGYERGKVPMSALTAESFSFREIFNPNNCKWDEFVKRYMHTNRIDRFRREDPCEHHFSDESLVRACIEKTIGLSSDKLIDIEREYDIWTDTIDRADWRIDLDKLKRGEYLEAHMLKPMHDNVNRIMPLIEYIGGSDLINFYKDLLKNGNN